MSESSTPRISLSPERYLGSARSERFASNEPLKLGEQIYLLPPVIPVNKVGFEGNKVFLVMQPKVSGEKVKILLNGNVVSSENAGKSVKDGFVTVTMPDLYELIYLKENNGEYIL